jgi:tRNA dimethylallyltransferase
VKRIVAIAGPTASGKSAAAIALAERVGGEVVSCDSVAVYRGFDVGAAKPSKEERERVRHHLVDVVDPPERFTAAAYLGLADRAIAGARVAIVAGGTGLYLRALLEGLFEAPAPDLQVREKIWEMAKERGWPALHRRLAEVDPEAAARIAPTDPIRISRALEVWEQTGVALSALHRAQRREPRYEALVIVVEPEREALERRIAERTRAMVAAGLVEEVRGLVARWGRDLKGLGAVGYKEALAHIDGRLAEGELAEAIRVATRRFARRQRTWFRTQAGLRVADAAALPMDVIERFLGGDGDR